MPPAHGCLVTLLLLSLPALGQSPTPTPVSEDVILDDVSVEERVTVSSRAAESQTASTTVLDRERIEASQLISAAQLVREVAGVHLLESGSLAGTSHVLTRGGDANFTLVLLDGIPLNDATDVQGGAFDLSTLDLDGIEGFEILRGPHSHFFGSSAVAGAINLVTRGAGSGPALRLRLDAGEDSLVHAGASASGPIGGGNDGDHDGDDPSNAADAYAGDDENTGFFVGAQYDRERHAIADDDYRHLALHGAVTVPLGETRAIRVTGRTTHLESEDYPEGSGGPVFGSGELRRTDGEQHSLGLTWGLDAGGWFHRGSAGGSRSRQDVDSPAIELSVPPSVEDRDYTRSQLSWITESGPLARGIRLSLGAQLDHDRGETESTLFLPDFLGGETAGDYRLSRTTPGAFAAVTLDAGPVTIEAGLRADDPEGLEVEWSPRLGLRAALGESGLSAHGSWSRAFKLPSFFALASPRALGGNPDLEPETSVGADLGLEWASGNARSQADVTLFSSTYHDLIDFDFESFLHVNRSSVDAEGVEVSARFRLHQSLVLSTAWTIQDVDSATSANVALHSPDHFGNLSLEWSPLEPLEVRIAGRVAGDTEDIQIPVPDRTHVEGYEVLDLAASWRASDRVLLRARLDNVTDEDYEQFVGFPQPGRRARVGVEYGFR